MGLGCPLTWHHGAVWPWQGQSPCRASYSSSETLGWTLKLSQAPLLPTASSGGSTQGSPGPDSWASFPPGPVPARRCLGGVTLGKSLPLSGSHLLCEKGLRMGHQPVTCPWGPCDLCLLPPLAQTLAEKGVSGPGWREGAGWTQASRYLAPENQNLPPSRCCVLGAQASRGSRAPGTVLSLPTADFPRAPA